MKDSMLRDARKTALNVEEAALLAAMPRPRMAGEAALRSARRGAERMERMTLGAEQTWGNGKQTLPPRRDTRGSRAALNHILKKQTGGK